MPYQSTHNTGGTTMGADRETSVVNTYLQHWDADNLFVVGAGNFNIIVDIIQLILWELWLIAVLKVF